MKLQFGFSVLLLAAFGCQARTQVETAALRSDALLVSADSDFTHLAIKQSLTSDDRTRLQKEYPKTLQKIENAIPLSTQDIQNLTRAGVKDEIILQAISTTHSLFFLMPSDVEELQQAGISQRVITAMKQTASDRYLPDR